MCYAMRKSDSWNQRALLSSSVSNPHCQVLVSSHLLQPSLSKPPYQHLWATLDPISSWMKHPLQLLMFRVTWFCHPNGTTNSQRRGMDKLGQGDPNISAAQRYAEFWYRKYGSRRPLEEVEALTCKPVDPVSLPSPVLSPWDPRGRHEQGIS